MCDQRHESNLMADPELRCPNCAYDLRGVQRVPMTCPECGKRCRIDELLRQHWIRKHANIPSLGWIMLPVSIFVFIASGPILALPAMLQDISFSIRHDLVLLVLFVLPLILWIASVTYVSRRIPGGLWLVLLGHVIFIFLFVGVIGSVACW